MAMAKAKAKEELVERIVVGPKPIHAHDPKTGERILAKIGDTVFLPARSAKTFARYLKAPGVAKAEAAVKAAEDKAAAAGAAEVAGPTPKEAPSENEGGGSDES